MTKLYQIDSKLADIAEKEFEDIVKFHNGSYKDVKESELDEARQKAIRFN
jgi:hypothetical protein